MGFVTSCLPKYVIMLLKVQLMAKPLASIDISRTFSALALLCELPFIEALNFDENFDQSQPLPSVKLE